VLCSRNLRGIYRFHLTDSPSCKTRTKYESTHGHSSPTCGWLCPMFHAFCLMHSFYELRDPICREAVTRRKSSISHTSNVNSCQSSRLYPGQFITEIYNKPTTVLTNDFLRVLSWVFRLRRPTPIISSFQNCAVFDRPTKSLHCYMDRIAEFEF